MRASTLATTCVSHHVAAMSLRPATVGNARVVGAISVVTCRSYSTSSQFAAGKLRNNQRILHPPRPHQAFADALYNPSSSLMGHTTEDAVNNILYNTPPPSHAPARRHILNCLVSNEPGVLARVSGVLAGRGFNIDSLVVARTEVPDLSRMTVVLRGQNNVVEQARRQLEDIVPVWAVLDYTHTKIVERELLLVKVAAIPPEHLSSGPTDSSCASTAAAVAAVAARKGAPAADAAEVADAAVDTPLRIGGAMDPGTTSALIASSVHRQAIINLAQLFQGRVVDVSMDSITVELCAKSERVDAFLKLCRPYGIIEAARSGTMAMPRSKVEGLFSNIDVESNDNDEDSTEKMDATMLPPG